MTSRVLIFTLLAGAALAADPSADSPWAQGRDLKQFAGLLRRSPFSLPTLEESAPLAQRFTLTGAFALDGETQIFVFDKTTFKRERVGSVPGPSGLQLVEFLPDADPRKMRATIRLGDQTATIAFTPSAAPATASSDPAAGKPNPASAQIVPPAAGDESAKRPSRIVIRRTKISGNPTPAQ